MPHFVEGFNRAYPDVTFVDYKLVNINYDSKTEVKTLTHRILPIRFADQILHKPYYQCMRSKYDMYELDWKTWRDVKPICDHAHALQLEIGLFGYGAPVEYNLVSPYYGTTSQFKADIIPDNGLPTIMMFSLSGYSIFDWMDLISRATTIHAVSSSIVYLLELLDLQAKEVHLYGREAIEKDTWYRNIEYLLTKDYVIHK